MLNLALITAERTKCDKLYARGSKNVSNSKSTIPLRKSGVRSLKSDLVELVGVLIKLAVLINGESVPVASPV